MKKGSINFSTFKKIWGKCSPKQKALLFYYSLFDFKAFEEDARQEIIYETEEIQKKLKELIKSINRRFFEKIEKEGFIKFVSSDQMLKFIIVSELKNRGIKISYQNSIFPDLIIEKNGKIHLEIKRLTTSKHIDEYLTNLETQCCERLFLLFFFPKLRGDNLERVKELTAGYYFLKRKLPNSKNIDMLIEYPDENNLFQIINKLDECLENPKWHENICSS